MGLSLMDLGKIRIQLIEIELIKLEAKKNALYRMSICPSKPKLINNQIIELEKELQKVKTELYD